MQTELKPEVVLCPNCKEEVPKTLYCLNCGYPLYKMDVLEKAKEEEPEEEPEDVVIEVTPEPFSLEPLKELAEIVPIEAEAEEPEVVEDAPVETTEIQAEVIPTDLALVIDEATDIEPVAEEEITVEDVVEHAVKVYQIEPEPVEEVVVEDAVEVIEVEEAAAVEEPEPEVEEADEEPFVEVVVEDAVEVIEVEEAAAVEEPEPEVEEADEEPFVEVVVEAEPSFEPDPIVRELMENFAKNIAMKVRLVKLLKDGEVKLETFNRLFESYAARGELLMNSRNEMLERVKFDLDNMERRLNEARIGLDELKIRKSIGDASEEEYDAKTPGFEWDIQKYQGDVEKSRAEIKFLGDLAIVISEDEISELRNLGREGLDSLEDLTYSGAINPEIAHRIKVTLDEAMSCLSNTCVG